MTRTALAALALLAATVALTAQPKAPKLPAGTAEHRDLRYGDHKERNTLDLYVPKSDKPVPLVIWVHGGGWEAGDKGNGGPAAAQLYRGYAVAAVNYRLSKHAPFPAQIEDVKAAVRFLRSNAKKYNLDPDRFGAWGSSAGGHLVALLGTSGDVKEFDTDSHKGVSSRVQCAIDYYGPTDLLKLSPPGAPANAVTRLLGGDTGDKRALATKANPITHVTKAAAPVLIVHGDADKLVPVSQSELLRDALKGTGVECELIVLKGAGHGGPQFGTVDMQERYNTFLDKHLKK